MSEADIPIIPDHKEAIEDLHSSKNVDSSENDTIVNHTPINESDLAGKITYLDDDYLDITDQRIVFNGIFDPISEFEKLQFIPKAERKEALELFKLKMVEQSKGYAKLAASLKDMLRSNPLVSESELMQEAVWFEKQFGIPPSSATTIDNVIKGVVGRRNKVRELFQSVSNLNVVERGKELCKQLLGFEPQGECNITPGSITANVNFQYPEDYAKAYLTGNGQPLTPDKLEESKISTGGFYTQRNGVGIIVENPLFASLSVTRHEEEHALYAVFSEVALAQINYPKPIGFYGEFNETIEKILKRQLVKARQYPLERARDEIFASMTNVRRSKLEVLSTLTKLKEDGGLYDYTNEFRKRMEELYTDPTEDYTPEASQQMLKHVNDMFITEYREILRKGLDAYEGLKLLGFNSSEVNGLLLYVPLEKWPRFLRFLKETKDIKLPPKKIEPPTDSIEEPVVQEPATNEELLQLVEQFNHPAKGKQQKPNAEQSRNSEQKKQEQLDVVLQTLNKYRI